MSKINSLSELNIGFDWSFDELNADIVLINMEVGESILDGTLVLNKITKSSVENVEYTLSFTYKGASKKAYLFVTNHNYMLIGHKGKNYDWLHQVLRDIEGRLVLDSINTNNFFHTPGIETIISKR